MKTSKLNLLKLFCFVCFLFSYTAHAQMVGGSNNNQSAPHGARVTRDQSKDLMGEVNLSAGTYNASYTLGTVKTLTGVSYTQTMSYSSNVVTGDNPEFVQGVPYGEGWNLNIPSISIHFSYSNKYDPGAITSAEYSSNCNDLNSYTFTSSELWDEGKLFWYSPELYIPGVASGRLVFKNKDYDGHLIFVLQKFDKYIEAELNANGSWLVHLPNGIDYVFGTALYSAHNASNQRSPTQLDLTNNTHLGVILPKIVPEKFYLTSIVKRSDNTRYRIRFNYKGLGKFNFYQDTDPFWGYVTAGRPEVFQEIFLTSIEAGFSDQDVFIVTDKLLLNYQDDQTLYGQNMLNLSTSGVKYFDDLYNYKAVYSNGMFYQSGSSDRSGVSLNSLQNFANWKRYVSPKYDNGGQGLNADPYQISPTDPFLRVSSNSNCPVFGGGDYMRKSITASGSISFNHSFLESPKIEMYQQTGLQDAPVLIPGGELYEVKTYISNANQYCNYDINIVSGSGEGDGTSNQNVQYDAYKYKRYYEIFSTFNTMLKWNGIRGGPIGGVLTTSNFFSMPVLPNDFYGFYIQVGPANSDNDFSIPAMNANIRDYSVCHRYGVGGCIAQPYTSETYYASSVYPPTSTKPDIVSGQYVDCIKKRKYSNIPHNFGMGLPWLTLKTFEVNTYLSSPNDIFKLWWLNGSTSSEVMDMNAEGYIHAPTLAGNSYLSGVDLIRYSKKPYMLKSVEHYLMNGANNATLVLVNKLEFVYENKQLKTYHNVQTKITGGNANCSSTGIYNQNQSVYNRNVILLTAIFNTNGNSSAENTQIRFKYTEWDYNNGSSGWTSYATGYNSFLKNGNGYMLTELQDPNGLKTVIKYKNTTGGNDVIPAQVIQLNEQDEFMSGDYMYQDACPGTNYVGPNELTRFIFIVESVTKNGTNALANKQVTGYSFTGFTPYFTTTLSEPNPYLSHHYTMQSGSVGTSGTSRYFNFSTTPDQPYTFQKATVSLPIISGEVSAVTEEHSYSTDLMFFGKLVKDEYFDKDKKLLKKVEYTYGYEKAYENGAFRTKYKDNLFYLDYQDYCDLQCNTVIFDPDSPCKDCSRDDNYSSSSVILSTDPSIRQTKIQEFDITIYDNYRRSYIARFFDMYYAMNLKSKENGTYLHSYFIYLKDQTTTDYHNYLDANQQPAYTSCSQKNEYEYYMANYQGLTTCQGFKYIMDISNVMSGAYIYQINYEPSWELYSMKTTSSDLPEAFTKQEHFYYYDLLNKYNYFTSANASTTMKLKFKGLPNHAENGLEGLFLARIFNERDVVFEIRQSSKYPGSNLHMQSVYYIYDKCSTDFSSFSKFYTRVENTTTITNNTNPPVGTNNPPRDVLRMLSSAGMGQATPEGYKPPIINRSDVYEANIKSFTGNESLTLGGFIKDGLTAVDGFLSSYNTSFTEFMENAEVGDIVAITLPNGNPDNYDFYVAQSYMILGFKAVHAYFNHITHTGGLNAFLSDPATTDQMLEGLVTQFGLNASSPMSPCYYNLYGDYEPSILTTGLVFKLSEVKVQIDDIVLDEFNANFSGYATSPILHFKEYTGTHNGYSGVFIGYQPYFPFETLTTRKIHHWNKFGGVGEESNQNELHSSYTFEENVVTINYKNYPTSQANKILDNIVFTNLKNLNAPLTSTIGTIGVTNTFTTTYEYFADYSLKKKTDPNNNYLEYEYDNFARLTKEKLNGFTLREYTHKNWSIADYTSLVACAGCSTFNYNDIAKYNYTETNEYNLPGSDRALVTRTYKDLLGRPLYAASQVRISGSNFENTIVKSGYAKFDQWDRKIATYKPYSASPGTSGAKELDLPSTYLNFLDGAYTPSQSVSERLYEYSMNSRLLKESDFGENISTSTHLKESAFSIISKSDLVAELGLNTTERDELMPQYATGSYQYYKTFARDQDNKQVIFYMNSMGQVVAQKGIISSGSNDFTLTLFLYDGQGNVSKTKKRIRTGTNTYTWQSISYAFNMMGWLTSKNTADEGETRFMYNRNGQVVLRQNEKERSATNPYYTVWTYDDFGRLKERYRIDPTVATIPGGFSSSEKDNFLPFKNVSLNYSNSVNQINYSINEVFSHNETYDWTFKRTINDGSQYPTVMTLENFLDLNTKVPEVKHIYDGDNYVTDQTVFLIMSSLSNLNQSGRLARSVSYDNAGNAVQYRFYAYYADGKTMWEMEQINPNGITQQNLGYLFKVGYGTPGAPQDFDGYTLRGTPRYKSVYTFDPSAQIPYGQFLEFRTYKYTYDDWGRLTLVETNRCGDCSQHRKVVEYSYNQATGRLINEKHYSSVPDNFYNICNPQVQSIDYSYDIRERLTHIDGDLFDENLFYDGNQPGTGILPQAALPTNTSTNYNGNINAAAFSYNFASVSGTKPGAFEFDFPTVYAYQYDALNRLTRGDATIGDFYYYNQANPSIPDCPQCGDESYTYDDIGNITSLNRYLYYMPGTTPAATQHNWTYSYYSGTNRLNTLTDNNQNNVGTYMYDVLGNLISDSYRGTSNIENGRDRTVFSLQTAGSSVTYKYLYNAFNERIYKEKTSSNTSTNSYEYTFAETGGAPLLQVDLQGSAPVIKQSYIQGLNLAAHEEYATNNTTSLIFHLYDHLGNTRVTYEAEPGTEVCTNITYNVVTALDYYPYGKTHRKYVAGNAERYVTTSNERDAETDYDYRMARFSDADMGRFLSVDPMANKYYASSPYNYVDGNPVMRTDPYGDDWFEGDRTGEVKWLASDKKNLQMAGKDGKMQNWTNIGTTAIFFDPETGHDMKGDAYGNKSDLGPRPGLLREVKVVAERNKPEDNSKSNDNGGVITIQRIWQTNNSTIGTFTTGDGKVNGYILEPAGPSTAKSGLDRRIPAGTYYLTPHSSAKYPAVFKLFNNQVPKSRSILIHSGNTPNHTEGCLIPGSFMKTDYVGNSKNTLLKLNHYINTYINNGGVLVIILEPNEP